MTTPPQFYSPAQIILHWVVVLSILLQWTFNEQMVRVVEAMDTGVTPVGSDDVMVWVHVGVVSTILFAVLAQLYMRYLFGTPDHAPGTPEIQAKIAIWMHRALYVTLLGMVITVGLTWNRVASLGTHTSTSIPCYSRGPWHTQEQRFSISSCARMAQCGA